MIWKNIPSEAFPYLSTTSREHEVPHIQITRKSEVKWRHEHAAGLIREDAILNIKLNDRMRYMDNLASRPQTITGVYFQTQSQALIALSTSGLGGAFLH